MLTLHTFPLIQMRQNSGGGQNMLSKLHLQAIIAAWPDDEGKSAHPEVYNEWIERCRRYDARVIQNALGWIEF